MNELKLSNEDLAELRDAFFQQAREILENLNCDILSLEKGWGEDDWKRVKRAFHTLKGDSRAMGFQSLATFAHRTEDLLASMKELGPGKESFDLLLACVDAFGGFLVELEENREPDIRGILERIDVHLHASADRDDGRKTSETVGTQRGKVSPLLKIETERVDRIMNLVGELVISRSTLCQLNSELGTLAPDTLEARLYGLQSSIERTLSELQRSVMKMRMLPIDLVFRRFPRIVRDLSAEKGKLVRLVLEGSSTELDKTIVDMIGEPLMHLVRNAVDHGLESPDQRGAAGKPQEGLVHLRAFHQGSQIVIEIEDDGAGIDTERLKNTAVRTNMLTPGEASALSEEEALNLIFLPGLSTAGQVTEISGRGVGMQIVKEVVESVRGLIEIDSRKGIGTKFTIRLPLTLAITKAILFTIDNEPYAIPLTSVTEIVRVFADEISTMAGKQVFRHRDRVVPLLSLNGAAACNAGKVFILFVGVAHLRAGIVAERIIGEEELVMKALDETASRGIASGASILGNGSVVLILDLLTLMKKNLRLHRAGRMHEA